MNHIVYARTCTWAVKHLICWALNLDGWWRQKQQQSNELSSSVGGEKIRSYNFSSSRDLSSSWHAAAAAAGDGDRALQKRFESRRWKGNGFSTLCEYVTARSLSSQLAKFQDGARIYVRWLMILIILMLTIIKSNNNTNIKQLWVSARARRNGIS